MTFTRQLWIEVRRSPMPLILPLIAALFWFDSYRQSTGQPPIWALRTFWNMGQGHTIIDFGPFVAGLAAWVGSRDSRRGTADLVTAGAQPRWTRQLVSWAATAIWAVGAYLVFVALMFAVYGHQHVRGQPPWWWVAVGATAVAAFSAAGFAVGAFFPSRFAAPIAAFGGFLAMMLSSQTGFRDTSGWALILPTNSNGNFQPLSGTLYPYLPDLPIARTMLLAGIATAVLGLLGVIAGSGSRWLRVSAAVVTLSGAAATGTAVELATTARSGPTGISIPALHDAANDRPIRFTPVCRAVVGVPVCLNPAYSGYLSAVKAALAPVLREFADLPGSPVRAIQVAGTYSSGEGEAPAVVTFNGQPPVLRLPLDAFNTLTSGVVGGSWQQFAQELQLLSVHAFVGAGSGAGTPAQQAVQAALLNGGGVPFVAQPRALTIFGLPGWAYVTDGGPGKTRFGPIYAAARRFAALPNATRHAWLAQHLAALRSGKLTLAQLP